MATEIDALVVSLGLDTTDFEKEFVNAKNTVGKEVARISGNMEKIGAAIKDQEKQVKQSFAAMKAQALVVANSVKSLDKNFSGLDDSISSIKGAKTFEDLDGALAELSSTSQRLGGNFAKAAKGMSSFNKETKATKALEAELNKVSRRAKGLRGDLADVEIDRKLLKDTKTLQQRMRAVNKETGKTKSLFQKLPLRRVGFAAVALGAFSLTKELSKQNKELEINAMRLGLTADEMQRLNFFAEHAAISHDQFADAVADLQEKIVKADESNNEYTRALEKLGLTTEHLVSLRADKMFEEVVKAIGKLPTPAERSAAAMQLMSDTGHRVVILAGQGAKSIENLSKEFESLGISIDDTVSKNFNDFDRELTNLTFTIKNFGNSIVSDWAGGIAGGMQILRQAMTDSREIISGLLKSHLEFNKRPKIETADVQGLADALAVASDEAQNFEKVWAGVGDAVNDLQLAPSTADNQIPINPETYSQLQQEVLKRQKQFYDIMATLQTDFHTTEKSEQEAALQELHQSLKTNLELREMELSTYVDTYGKQLEQLLQQDTIFAARSQAIWDSGFKGKLQSVQSILGDMSTLMQAEHRDLFNIGKAFALADTAVNTALSAQRAYTAFSWSPPLAIAAASAATAAGLLRAQQIATTQYNGRTASTPSGGSSAASTPAVSGGANSTAQPEVTNLNLTIQGEFANSRDALAALAGGINELTNDGFRINLQNQ